MADVGFGPEVGDPYEDVRYPVESVDQLVASFPAYVSTSGGGGGSRFASPQETAALEALFNRIGPSVLLVHSAGGGSDSRSHRLCQTSLNGSSQSSRSVGAPTDPPTVAEMGGDAPFMGVYGDYVDEREQTGRKEATQTTAELAGEASPASTLLSLPDEGISGNTHLMMQDDNNGEIADRILTWIGLIRGVASFAPRQNVFGPTK